MPHVHVRCSESSLWSGHRQKAHAGVIHSDAHKIPLPSGRVARSSRPRLAPRRDIFADGRKRRGQEQGDQKQKADGEDASKGKNIGAGKPPDARARGRLHVPHRVERVLKLNDHADRSEQQGADANDRSERSLPRVIARGAAVFL
jgi:hypothetical protein